MSVCWPSFVIWSAPGMWQAVTCEAHFLERQAGSSIDGLVERMISLLKYLTDVTFDLRESHNHSRYLYGSSQH